MEVAIVGGGLAGVSAARFIKELVPCRVTILEKEKETGGLCRTWERPDGDRYEFGPHFFHSKNHFILDSIKPEVEEISYPVEIITKSCVENRLYDYPMSIDTILELPYTEKIEVIDELYKTDLTHLRKKETFNEYVRTLVGKTLFEKFFLCYTEKLWGLPAENIPASWAPQRISFRKQDKRFFCDEWCVYFYHGIASLINFLKNRADARQLTEINILRIEKKGSKWQIITNTGSEAFDIVVSTAPITQTLDYVGCREISPLSYRGFMVMYIEVFRKQATSADWIYFPEKKYIFTRIFELKKFRKPPQTVAKSSITVEIPCSYNDDVWNLSDRDIENIVKQQLNETGLFTLRELGQSEIIRRKHVYPVQDMGSSENIHQNIEALAQYPGIVPAGRLGIFKYMNMDETIISSLEAVRNASNTLLKKA